MRYFNVYIYVNENFCIFKRLIKMIKSLFSGRLRKGFLENLEGEHILFAFPLDPCLYQGSSNMKEHYIVIQYECLSEISALYDIGNRV